MLKNSLTEIFKRDLEKLKDEINLFEKEEDIWITPGSIKNSPGNLCLHICGNLNHFVGSILGKSDYVREREREFSIKNLPRKELIEMIEKTSSVVAKTFEKLDEESFNKRYPIVVFGSEMSTEFFLIHLATHLNYHLGQINYLRRILID
jgi:uncharacterized damage-inducible protein DinB